MATPAEIKALFETGDVLLASSFVTFVDSVHPEACDLGTFTGTTITNGGTVKEALQELETALEDIEAGSGVTDHGALTGLADDDHTQYLLADGSRAISAPITGATPTETGHLATKGYVDGVAGDFQYEVKTDDFTAAPGKIYLISLASGDVIATVPTTAGACSLVVIESGTTDPGYGQPLVANKLTIAGTELVFVLPGDRIDFQSDGTNTVYQIIDDDLEDPTFSYTDGNLTGAVFSNGTVRTYTYTDGNLTQIQDTLFGMVTTYTYGYTDGNLTSVTKVIS